MAKKKKKSAQKRPAQTRQAAPDLAETVGPAIQALVGKLREAANSPAFRNAIKSLGDSMDSQPQIKQIEAAAPAIEGDLRDPDRYERGPTSHKWYWYSPGVERNHQTLLVIAESAFIDSTVTEDVLQGKPGARAGDYAIHPIGGPRGSLFPHHPHEAMEFAEAILSAIRWEDKFPNELAGMGGVDVDQAAPVPEPGMSTTRHKCCEHCTDDAHAPHSRGCPEESVIDSEIIDNDDDDDWNLGDIRG